MVTLGHCKVNPHILGAEHTMHKQRCTHVDLKVCNPDNKCYPNTKMAKNNRNATTENSQNGRDGVTAQLEFECIKLGRKMDEQLPPVFAPPKILIFSADRFFSVYYIMLGASLHVGSQVTLAVTRGTVHFWCLVRTRVGENFSH